MQFLHSTSTSPPWASFQLRRLSRPSRRRSCFLPGGSTSNLYAVSAWSRTMILPLAIVCPRSARCGRCSRRPAESEPTRNSFLDFETANSPHRRPQESPAPGRELFLLIDLALSCFQYNLRHLACGPSRQQALLPRRKWIARSTWTAPKGLASAPSSLPWLPISSSSSGALGLSRQSPSKCSRPRNIPQRPLRL